MLTQFLTDIGAASLSPAVDLPANAEVKSPFAALHDRLTEEIASINDKTRQLLEENWSDFQEQVADGKELLVRMEEEESELLALEGELAGDRAFLPSLVERLTAHSKLAQTNSLATHTLTLINSLLSLHASISTVSNYTTAGSLPLAVASLRELQSALTRGAEPWIEQTDAWNALKRWAADEQIRLEGSVAGALDGCFEFSPTATTAGTTLALRTSVAAAPRGELLSVPVLLQALEDVFVMDGQGKKVEAQLARVSKQLLKYFVVPFLENNGRPDSDGKLDIAYAEERGAWTATIRPRATGRQEADEEPLKEIAKLLTFFAKHTHLFPPSPYAANFTANLTPTIQTLIISSHLAPSLPASIDLIPPYLALLSAASTFESQFLSSAGYFAFLPKETHGQPREEARVIQSWVERVDKHWAGKVGDAALEKVRDEIMHGDWSGEKMEIEVEVEGEGGQMTKAKEQVLVSSRSKEIVAAADEVLDRAVSVGADSFPHPTFATASPLLLRTFISILSLYRAIVPVHHSTLLDKDFGISMQFANDTDWIGEQVNALWRKSKTGQSSSVRLDVEQALQTTQKLGKEWREKQIAIQRDQLMDQLDQANRFLYTADDARFSACERALQQITENLERLVKDWKPVLNTTLFYSTLGSLVNEVLQRVLDEIMDQTDISEEESIRLNKLCKMLHELETLFEGEQTSIGIEVPVWFKFVFLSELLEASMADILFLFDDGHLVDFEPAAIAKLVRALFSDSPLRNRNLEHILKGHPAVVPGRDEEVDDSRAASPIQRHVAPASAPPAPRSPSPPPAPAPTTRFGRQPLGTRIVNARPSFPSPPPSPPMREPTPPPPPPPPAPVAAAPPASSGPPEIDPELDASFDDVGDDAWDFSPIASPVIEAPVPLPSPPKQQKVLSPPPSKPKATSPPASASKKLVASPSVVAPRPLVSSPPPGAARLNSPPPVSRALPSPKPAPKSIVESAPIAAAAAAAAAAAVASVTAVVETRDRSTSIVSSNGGEAEDAWGLDDAEVPEDIVSPPKEEPTNLPVAESAATEELGVEKPVVAESALVEPEVEVKQDVEPAAEAEVAGDGWDIGEEQSPEVDRVAEQDPSFLAADASPEQDSPFEFDQVLPLAEQSSVKQEAVVLPPRAHEPSPLVVETSTLPPPPAELALSPPPPPLAKNLLSTSGAEEQIHEHVASQDAGQEQELEPEPQEEAELDLLVAEPQTSAAFEPEHLEHAYEERRTQFYEQATRAVDEQPSALEPSPFEAHHDTSTSALFGGAASSSSFDNVGSSPFDSAGPSPFDDLGHDDPFDEPLSRVEETGPSPPLETQQEQEQHLVEPLEEQQEHAAELSDALEAAREEQRRAEPVTSPILHAEHTATIVHDVSEEAEEAGWDLGAGDDEEWMMEEQVDNAPKVQEHEREEQAEPTQQAFDEHGEDVEQPQHLEESQHLEYVSAPVVRSPSPPLPPLSPSPPPRDARAPSPSPPRSPSPPPRRPSPPAHVEEDQADYEPASGFVKMGAQDERVSVEEPLESTSPMFVNETMNDDEWPIYAEKPPNSPPSAEPASLAQPPPSLDPHPSSPLVGVGSSPDIIEHASPITTPEPVEHHPADLSSSDVQQAPVGSGQVKEEVPLEQEVHATELRQVPEVPSALEQPLEQESFVEENSSDEPFEREMEQEQEVDEWELGAGGEAEKVDDEEEEVDQDHLLPTIPTPPSPVLAPLDDSGPAPTPLQHASPPAAPSPSAEVDVATPAHELHLEEATLEPQVSPIAPYEGGYDSPALVPDGQEVKAGHEVIPVDPEAVEALVTELQEQAEEEEEEDGGWGIDEELEGLEEAGEDDLIAPVAYTPISPPRPLPYALPMSPPPRPRTPPPPRTPPQPTNGRFSSPVRPMPSYFSPPRARAAPTPVEVDLDDDGGDSWGFDVDEAEDDGGLGYMDDSPSREGEELGRSLFESAPAPLSPPPVKRASRHVKAPSVDVDDDAWGL